MSILNKKALDELKSNYNYYLLRYNKGCDYLEKNISEIDKWTSELLDIIENLNLLLEEIQKNTEVSNYEILNGFKI